jgi:TorA maturation chaperone TorD
MSTTSASTAPARRNEDPAQRLARADLFRFLAACYYEPGLEFAEERLFDSMFAASAKMDPDLARQARRLGKAFSSDRLENLLVDYTRLFLGPVRALAQPYASVWMNGETPVLPMYAEAGFEIDESFRDLPDHIAVELEFLYLLIHRDDDLRRRVLAEHLGRWIPAFTQAVWTGAASAFYRELVVLTDRMIALEARR